MLQEGSVDIAGYVNQPNQPGYRDNNNYGSLLQLFRVGLSQICSKSCPKCFWNIPKIFSYYALQVSHYASI